MVFGNNGCYARNIPQTAASVKLIVGGIIANLRTMSERKLSGRFSMSISMKSGIILLVLSSMLLQSCYSYFNITGEERQQIMQSGETPIQIVLADGQEVIVDPYHYVYVTEPTDGIYVTGELVQGSEARSFHGLVRPTRIDSSEVVVKRLFISETKETYYDLWVSDSSKVTCTKADMIRISKSEGPGLWVNGYIVMKSFMGAKETKSYVGKVPDSDAQHVEQKKLSWLRTAATTLAIGTVMTVAIIAFPPKKSPN